MKKRYVFALASVLLLLLLLAGCGKAASMRNYRAYASGIVNAYVTDEDQREDMLGTIKDWKKESDYDNFAALVSYYSNGYIKSYDSWVAAGCPTPVPTASPVPTAKAAAAATTAPAATAKPATATTTTTTAAATPAPVQSAPANQSGTAAVAPQGGGAPGASGEPSGTPPAA